MAQIREPLARDHLEHKDIYLNKLGKGPIGSAAYHISSI